MTSSNFGQQPPDNQQPGDNPEDSGLRQESRGIVEFFNLPRRIKKRLRRIIEEEAKRQVKEEIEQVIIKEIEQKAKEKLEEKITQEIKELLQAKAEPKVLEALNKFNIDKELNSTVNKFTENYITKARNKLEDSKSKFDTYVKTKKQEFDGEIDEKKQEIDEKKQEIDEKKQEIDKEVDKKKEEINKKKKEIDKKITDQTNEIQRVLKIYKNIEPELLKIRALIILTPAILIAFGIFFGDRIKDIMSIDVLEAEIENLKNGTQPGQPPYQGQGVCPPGDETCCSPEGFFTC